MYPFPIKFGAFRDEKFLKQKNKNGQNEKKKLFLLKRIRWVRKEVARRVSSVKSERPHAFPTIYI